MNVNLFGLPVCKQCLGIAFAPFQELPSLTESSLGLHSELPGRLMGVSMLVFLGYTADNCFIPIWDDATIKLISTARSTRSGDLKKIMNDGMAVNSNLTEEFYCFPLAYMMWDDINARLLILWMWTSKFFALGRATASPSSWNLEVHIGLSIDFYWYPWVRSLSHSDASCDGSLVRWTLSMPPRDRRKRPFSLIPFVLFWLQFRVACTNDWFFQGYPLRFLPSSPTSGPGIQGCVFCSRWCLLLCEHDLPIDLLSLIFWWLHCSDAWSTTGWINSNGNLGLVESSGFLSSRKERLCWCRSAFLGI